MLSTIAVTRSSTSLSLSLLTNGTVAGCARRRRRCAAPTNSHSLSTTARPSNAIVHHHNNIHHHHRRRRPTTILQSRFAWRSFCSSNNDSRAKATEIYENKRLAEVDPDMHALIVEEQARQLAGLEFIASEVSCSSSLSARCCCCGCCCCWSSTLSWHACRRTLTDHTMSS
jgi:hypothetical protein